MFIPTTRNYIMNIKFDSTALGSATLNGSNVYVTFAAQSSKMTYFPAGGKKMETINFSASSISIEGVNYGTSRAYTLDEINANGLVLTKATSLVGFISYGSATGIEKLGVGAQPNFLSASTPRYSIFEISYSGETGGADITNISQFGGSIVLEFQNNGITQKRIGNTLGTTDMFNALAACSGFSGTASTSVILTDTDGKFIRAIGTNIFPNGTEQTPYPKYNAYLQSLYNAKGATKSVVAGLTNLAPGASAGGAGSAGFPTTVNATNVTPSVANSKGVITESMIYNLDYHFSAFVTQVTAPSGSSDPNGTYKVTLKGHVNATRAESATTEPIKSHKYDNLEIEIAADDLVGNNLYMTNFMYQAATTGAGISVTTSGWDELNNDFGDATVTGALMQKAAGDFAEGMTCGFPGSTTDSTSKPGTALGELTSYEWWLNPQLAYSLAQPSNPYYSLFGNAVFLNSDGKNGSDFSYGGVYGSPYDDRFGLNLISPDSETTDMLIKLMADGDLTPS